MSTLHLLPVLLAGGSGTRLWPLSRELYPKQFLSLVDEHSLLQNTAHRAAALPGALPPLVICGEPHRFIAAEQLRQAGTPGCVMLEPEGRNTAPAAAVAALHAQERSGPDTLVFLMAADHAIRDQTAFRTAVDHAVALAQAGRIVTFGIQPTHPETGYGYLQAGEPLPPHGHAVARFIEKPPLATAQALIAQGGHYWNGGMFLFRADVFLKELERLEPAMLEQAREALARGQRDLDFVRLDAAAFKACRNDSIDYAVMEKTALAALVTLDAGWDDVGSWTYLAQRSADARGNRVRGDVLLEDADNNLVQATSRLVSLVGVRDHIVVETADAILVTTRDHAQDVKKVVQRLKADGRSEAQLHPRVFRPWGWYESISAGERFQVKRIQVAPGQKLSLQMHHHRAEHWIVVHGTARVTCEDKVFLLAENESTYIPLGHRHRLENPGAIPLEIIEVQSGGYLGEDDIVRFEDIYGRSGG
ncbi:MAG TPA: mannose-1-phosphate guanylyltransferase/mannose-6-phosphate isomerase [Solimonas sp.]|nr:mannose-1-phosphate guanylyltransferase/mannose-6-phosphate isomerase [Solimonas sp.]